MALVRIVLDLSSLLSFMPYVMAQFSSIPFDIAQNSLLKFPTSSTLNLTTKVVSTKFTCIDDCAGTPWCLSINFKMSAESNGHHLCELLSSDSFNNEHHLTKNERYIHYSIKNPCKYNSIACANGGSCTFHFNKKDYRCVCIAGYYGNLCKEDIDECAVNSKSSPCHKDATCKNLIGSFVCKCKDGYHGDGNNNCADIDECATNQHSCGGNGACVNKKGSYTCNCKIGRVFNGTTCVRYSFRGLGNSAILTKYGNGSYFQELSGYLNPVLKHSDSYWVRCWHGIHNGFAASTFHSQCDRKGPTVMIVLVSPSYIFGGYTDKSWDKSDEYYGSTVAFLYSLYNINGYAPIKLKIKDTSNAMHCYERYGPAFGTGYDIYISSDSASNTQSNTNAQSYETPPGCITSKCNFLAGTHLFKVKDIEVFYEVDGNKA